MAIKNKRVRYKKGKRVDMRQGGRVSLAKGSSAATKKKRKAAKVKKAAAIQQPSIMPSIGGRRPIAAVAQEQSQVIRPLGIQEAPRPTTDRGQMQAVQAGIDSRLAGGPLVPPTPEEIARRKAIQAQPIPEGFVRNLATGELQPMRPPVPGEFDTLQAQPISPQQQLLNEAQETIGRGKQPPKATTMPVGEAQTFDPNLGQPFKDPQAAAGVDPMASLMGMQPQYLQAEDTMQQQRRGPKGSQAQALAGLAGQQQAQAKGRTGDEWNGGDHQQNGGNGGGGNGNGNGNGTPIIAGDQAPQEVVYAGQTEEEAAATRARVEAAAEGKVSELAPEAVVPDAVKTDAGLYTPEVINTSWQDGGQGGTISKNEQGLTGQNIFEALWGDNFDKGLPANESVEIDGVTYTWDDFHNLINQEKSLIGQPDPTSAMAADTKQMTGFKTDPDTGELVPITAEAKQALVIDPVTGEAIYKEVVSTGTSEAVDSGTYTTKYLETWGGTISKNEQGYTAKQIMRFIGEVDPMPEGQNYTLSDALTLLREEKKLEGTRRPDAATTVEGRTYEAATIGEFKRDAQGNVIIDP